MMCFPCSARIFSARDISSRVETSSIVITRVIGGRARVETILLSILSDVQITRMRVLLWPYDRFSRFRDLVRVRKDGGLDGAQDSLFPLCRPARDNLLSADEQAVVYDEVNAKPAGNLAGLEALSRAAFADQGKRAGFRREPGKESLER